MTFKDAIEKIGAENTQIKGAAMEKWDSIAKPLCSLGLFETNITKIVMLTGKINYTIDKRSVVVMCADNGVVLQGISQSGQEITGLVAENLTRGETCVCRMAKMANADVIPVDIGICTDINCEGLLARKIRYGTDDMSIGAAMTREECVRAVEVGINLCFDLKAQGYKIIATGEMGIGNTTTSSAVASVLLGVAPQMVTGRGAGLSAEGVCKKIAVIEQAIRINAPNADDVIDIICKVGGLDIAGLVGIFIGGAVAKIPIIIDGFISSVAALSAARICNNCKNAMIASHISAEPAGKMLLEALGMEPTITAKMCLGEGTGAVALMPLLDMAFDIYNNMSTFKDIKMENYEHLI